MPVLIVIIPVEGSERPEIPPAVQVALLEAFRDGATWGPGVYQHVRCTPLGPVIAGGDPRLNPWGMI